MKPIAHIENDFPTKFGIPRQSGLVNSLHARIVMEPEYRNPDAFRGLEDYSHIWLIWEFSQAVRQKWSPTVRPPRLGGNVRMGVFATRSPFRPNPLGLSVVQLEEIVLHGANAPYLTVSGADLMHGTPITTSSRTCHTLTATPKPGAVLLCRQRLIVWKFAFRKSGWRKCRNPCGQG